MGFGPMMSSLMRNKTGPMLVALQIAVTLAIVINSLFIILQRVEKMDRDTGIDVNNVIVTYVRGFGEDFDVIDSVTNDINLLKSIPGVITAAVSNQVPLSGSGSSHKFCQGIMVALWRETWGSRPGILCHRRA